MSKQFYVYLLPSDLEQVTADLRNRFGVVLISPTSDSSKVRPLHSPIRKGSLLSAGQSVCADCCLTESTADVRLNFYPNQSIWRVADTSEVINISGCDFDGKTLVRGRFYVQTDMLVENEIVKKRQAFVIWADKVFSSVKKQLSRSSTLDAYVGEAASSWQEAGGRYASLALPGREPLYEKSVSG